MLSWMKRMSVLDAFVPENHVDGVVFFSLMDYGLTFSKASVEKLGYPSHVRIYFDQKGKRMAVVPCGEETGARRFVREGEQRRTGFVRWNDKKLTARIRTLGGMEAEEGKGVRVLGEYVPEENLLVYHLTQILPAREKRTHS